MPISLLRKLFSRPDPVPPPPPPVPLPHTPEVDVGAWFWTEVAKRRPRRVLEVGTLRAQSAQATHVHDRFPEVADRDYVRLDITAGPDVDVVGDVHALPADWTDGFDVFLANAVWEHLERPWIAAREVARVLAPGGIFLIGTHQTFPLHGFPDDFFRFSREALRLLFEDAGLTVAAADYRERCLIIPPPEVVPGEGVIGWNELYPSYAVVQAAGEKPRG